MNNAVANLPITIILVISVVTLGVAMEDAYAQSDHAIVLMYIFLCERILVTLYLRLSDSFF